MKNKFEISDDGSIFTIGDDGTIHRIGKVDSQGNIESSTQGKASGTLWFFLIIAIIASVILGINLYSTNEDLFRIRDSESKYKSDISKLKQQNEYIENEKSSLQYKFDDLRERFPLKITRIELANTQKDGAIIDNFDSFLYSHRLQYLSPKIYFKNYLKKSKTFNFSIHYINTYGHLEYNTTTGKIPTSENYISTMDESIRLAGWGSESSGTWGSGSWTVEIWHNGVCLGSQKFTIY